ncbi:MAG: TonB-dependent receptor plug domain-containing protein [Candidatus Rokubacteria bacterium]|nr:TonB-dependent receptor plug domain-containing protein [Candidatus Rokubacteria bacterium]
MTRGLASFLTVLILLQGCLLPLGSEALAQPPASPPAEEPREDPAESPPTAPAPPPAPAPPALETGPEAMVPILPSLIITAPPPVASSSTVIVPGKDIELRPQGRPADILRLVPGLVIAQHTGGGKAEQYFLRGFDADHGTDIAFFVDGFPVNLPSHAHGQGYTDLHFIIPEVVKQLDAYKGPYYPEFGDFATAGAFNFATLDLFPDNVAQAVGGTFDTQRYLLLLSPTRDRLKTLLAIEEYYTNGPFDRAQTYNRFNVFAKASAALGEDVDASAWVSYNLSSWFASGLIPNRAVLDGSIDRFGSIDNSEGGSTQSFKANTYLTWRFSENQQVLAQAYAQYYQLDLFSNFTFFLTDPEFGDGIQQYDRRWVAGANVEYRHQGKPFGVPTTGSAGFQFRIDTPRVILANQQDRNRLSFNQNVDIVQASYSPFVKLDIAPLPWLRIVTGARGDIFTYDVQNRLADAPGSSGNAVKAVPGGKFNLILGPWYQTEFFANVGSGFHSNDARAVVADPSLTALPQAFGYEFGFKTSIIPRVQFSATYWYLHLDSELVFVGDEGVTEASGPSTRYGGEVAARVQILDWLSAGGNFTISRGNFDNGDALALAPRLTALADITARFPWGLSASLSMRYLADRFLTEDRTQTAAGYTVLDFTARYRYKWLEAILSIENLTNTKYRESQFFYTSRLRGEPPEGVADTHFTPGNPLSVLGGIAIHF